MAMNLLKAGYSLLVWNRTKSKMDELLAMGATEARSPKEVAENSEIVITMVSNSEGVKEVVFGTLGIIEGTNKNMVLIDMSTISIQVSRLVAEALSKKGVEVLDAPVSGGEAGAKEGSLSIMVGGSNDVFERCLPIFKVLGKKITYMGKNGMGQATKICNQVICGLNIQAVCEGMMLGAKLGLDLDKMLEVVMAGAAKSWMLSSLGPKMLKRDFEPGFKIIHQQKDLRLALNEASERGLALPGTALVQQMLNIAESAGMAEKGTQASIVAMERIAGHKLTVNGMEKENHSS